MSRRSQRRYRASCDLVVLWFGLFLIAAAIGTLARKHGVAWHVFAVIELVLGAALACPLEYLRKRGG